MAVFMAWFPWLNVVVCFRLLGVFCPGSFGPMMLIWIAAAILEDHLTRR